jgi:hypothetical protein
MFLKFGAGELFLVWRVKLVIIIIIIIIIIKVTNVNYPCKRPWRPIGL